MNAEDFNDEIRPAKRHFGIEQMVFILLILLSLVGIVITDFNPDDGYGYWLAMVFVFGLLAIFVARLQAKSSEADLGKIVKAQAMHWLHTIVVVAAASMLNKSGQLAGVSADMLILLILGLSTMLDGYHIGWQFSLLGFFLVGCALTIAYIQPFLWACLILAGVVVAASFLRSLWAQAEQDEVE